MTCVLVVEDEKAIQELLVLTLSQSGFETLCAGSAEEALSMINHALPDLVLLDWMLPGQSGVELAQKLRKMARTAKLPILLLTARADEDDKIEGLEAGADDYVTKPFSPKELVARLNALLRRVAPHLSADTLESGGIELNPTTHQITVAGQLVDLAPSEFRLLSFLMAHPDRVWSRGQLLNNIWGDHVFIDERTVDVHIRRLRKALETHGVDHFIDTVRGVGYRFVGKP